MKKLFKHLSVLAVIVMVVVPVFALVLNANAQGGTDNLLWGNQQGNVDTTLGLGNKDPRVIAASVVNIMLGFLGIIAVLIILLGGFKWMTAGGNEDSVAEAKKIIGAGVIGLIIVLASFGLAQFVIEALANATGAG